jgi:hypothetical protein
VSEDVVRTCSACGTQATAPEGGVPEGWSMATERKRVTYQCPSCVRTHLRAIEGKLPEEYW